MTPSLASVPNVTAAPAGGNSTVAPAGPSPNVTSAAPSAAPTQKQKNPTKAPTKPTTKAPTKSPTMAPTIKPRKKTSVWKKIGKALLYTFEFIILVALLGLCWRFKREIYAFLLEVWYKIRTAEITGRIIDFCRNLPDMVRQLIGRRAPREVTLDLGGDDLSEGLLMGNRN